MNPWTFIIGAYAVTAIALLAEIIALRMRSRAARAALHQEPPMDTRSDRPTHRLSRRETSA